MSLSKPHIGPIEIKTMTYSGRGLGYHNGKPVFVYGAIPGDVAFATIVKDGGSYIEAISTQFTELSPQRKPSPCKFSSTCGGCQWLHVPYHKQLQWKEQFIIEAFEKIGRIRDLPKIAMIAAESTLHYRNRVLTRGTVLASGKVTIGFFAPKSHEQVTVTACAIADKKISYIIKKVNDLKLKSESCLKFRLEIQNLPHFEANQIASILCLLHPVSKNRKEIPELQEKLSLFPEVLWAGSEKTRDNRVGVAIEKHKGATYYSSPGQFFQININQNHILRKIIGSILQQNEFKKTIVDLFCGSGNISLSIPKGNHQIIGVEANQTAIELAKLSADDNQKHWCKFTSMDCATFLKKFNRPKDENKELWIIADPPREGMKRCIPDILRLSPEKIVYISCNPVTLARDVATLLPSYKLNSVSGLDFFPQTFHIETIAVLSKTLP